jgi:putative NIF3 family GTP cyclohydrolase 1 type 2
MSIIAMQASAIQSFNLLSKDTLYKMASELFGEIVIFDMNVVTLRNMLARRYFFGALKVIWKEFPSDVVQHMLSFVDMDINHDTRIHERIYTQYMRADFSLYKIHIGAEPAQRYVRNVFGVLVTENITDALTVEHNRLARLLENKGAYNAFLQAEEQDRPAKYYATKGIRQRNKEIEDRHLVHKKRAALLKEITTIQKSHKEAEVALHKQYLQMKAELKIHQEEELLATCRHPAQIREIKRQIQARKDHEARYKALKEQEAAERQLRTDTLAHYHKVRTEEFAAVKKASKERAVVREKDLRKQWQQYRATQKRAF